MVCDLSAEANLCCKKSMIQIDFSGFVQTWSNEQFFGHSCNVWVPWFSGNFCTQKAAHGSLFSAPGGEKISPTSAKWQWSYRKPYKEPVGWYKSQGPFKTKSLDVMMELGPWVLVLNCSPMFSGGFQLKGCFAMFLTWKPSFFRFPPIKCSPAPSGQRLLSEGTPQGFLQNLLLKNHSGQMK